MPPIRIHPANPKLFEFRDKPLFLLTATEHYGAVMNRPFRYDRYLADAADKKITLTRLFTLFRELQTPINPYSTCKPETQDYVAPFVRTGPGRARDLEPQYDLDQPNPEFYERLHGFLRCASDHGIIVEVVLLSNVYTDQVWGINPLHPENNIQNFPDIPWYETMTQRHVALFERQVAHVRRIVSETNTYDNIIYEICNEPGGSLNPDSPTCAEVDEWLKALIAVIRQTEKDLPNQHLIAGQQSFAFSPWEQPIQATFQALDYDVVNVHALPNTTYGNQSYALGPFMSKQLKLRPLRDFGLATYGDPKPLNQDEDNIASQYRDYDGWTIHRKRAWTTLMTGGHYDYIDFSIQPYLETGTPDSQAHIRSWMKYLSAFIHSFDLVNARPLSDVVIDQPPFVLPVGFGVTGVDYGIYLADERELLAARDINDDPLQSPDAGGRISGSVTLQLPTGHFSVASYAPESGLYSPAFTISGGEITLQLPDFHHDIALRIQKITDR